MRVFFVALFTALMTMIPASAGATQVSDVGRALKSSPLYVDQDVENALTAKQRAELIDVIDSADDRDVYVAVLPARAAEVNNGIVVLTRRIAYQVGDPTATYVVVAGDRATALSGSLKAGLANEILTANASKADTGLPAVLATVVRQLVNAPKATGDIAADAMASPTRSSSEGSTPSFGAQNPQIGWWLGGSLIGFVIVGALTFAWFAIRDSKRSALAQQQRERERAADQEQVERMMHAELSVERELIDDLDTVATSQDDQEALAEIKLARVALTNAETYLKAEDVRPERVGKHVFETRFHRQVAQALVAPTLVPERRSGCLFDPAHGLSVIDVAYDMQEDGRYSDVPACTACAQSAQEHGRPAIRQIQLADGTQAPYLDHPRTAQARYLFSSLGVTNARSQVHEDGQQASRLVSQDSDDLLGTAFPLVAAYMAMSDSSSSAAPSSSYSSDPVGFSGSDFGSGFGTDASSPGGSW